MKQQPSFRTRLRAFQRMHGDVPDPGFVADLEYLENRDLDLSVRMGGMLAFNALLITIGTHPVSASPGAPLSLDAAAQPAMTLASLVGVIPFVLSSAFVLRGLLIGEDFDPEGCEDDQPDMLRRRLMAAFVRSIDAQTWLLRRAVQASIAGGVLTALVWGWILAAKMLGAQA
ncbi:hypothetical protein [Sphingomonas astaxanthinifaciens]|uniref:Uncharacterized protein n=1 Tax=Sphingomonas astaxanthinifaciens DSM 22298 TaxID=1123267 RepID=A0ABQ5Z5Q9_9SPHN|nr:hypothetical protein [Sphingomonas astaxanthinifaciens]GLR46827.1 hypothetical protein GCM10007925_05380 [Sphingomonas astaxanthinifaciens DSM 22298]